jgi:hypothetical protein
MRASDALHCACCVLLGCAQVDVIAISNRASAAGSGGSGMTRDGGSPASCAYRTRSVTAGGKPAVLKGLVASGLLRAVCACDGLSTSENLDTDAFDGDLGPYGTGQAGGDVGVNQDLSLGTSSTLWGSLIAAGAGGVSLVSDLELRVGANVEIAGPLAGAASVLVGGDASVADRIELSALTVKGTLTQPAGATRHVSGNADIGSLQSAPVRVANPCSCDAASLLDIAALVSQAVSKAEPISGKADVLDLDCGEYALAKYDATGLHITVRKSAALYVAGDLHLSGDLVIDTADGADLDLFVAGNLKVDGLLTLGATDRTARVRLYVGDSGTTQLGGGGELHGALYAPLSEIVINAKLTIYGALLARRIAASAPLSIHYDQGLSRP